jgi:uncharacterized membrane protein YvbJ
MMKNKEKESKYCSNCGLLQAAKNKFCPQCGHKFKEMFDEKTIQNKKKLLFD